MLDGEHVDTVELSREEQKDIIRQLRTNKSRSKNRGYNASKEK